MFISVIYMYVCVYPPNMVCLAGQVKKINWLCVPRHQSSQVHQNWVCRSTCPLLIPTQWTSFLSKVVGVCIQDCCLGCQPNWQSGLVSIWCDLAGWVGISWQSWPEGKAWQWLDPCWAESYTADSCWGYLDYFWVCGMGVKSVQGHHVTDSCVPDVIQWYPFDKPKHSFHGMNPKVMYIHYINMYKVYTISYMYILCI